MEHSAGGEENMWQESPRVLLADAQCAARDSLQQQLTSAGYDVDVASCGSDVILLCESQPPDVIIMDVHLPDMDGFEVCEYIRHETRDADVTVIIMTEPSDHLTRAYLGPMVEFVGGDYYFAKPCDGKLIVQLLDDLTDDSGSDDDGLVSRCPTRVVWPTSRRSRQPATV